ncbi:MAG: ABC transporter permease [Acidimicrobiales bacterium]|nr:ABC transporter permease [Acidimicrobiales bacterium]
MFLGLRDLRVSKSRFVLVGSVLALIALLSTLLSGLANGLVDDGISGLRALPLSHLVFQEGAQNSFSRSVLGPDVQRTFGEQPGVQVTPVGMSFVNAKTGDGTSVDLALFGVDPTGFLASESAAAGRLGERGGALDHGLVLSDELRDTVAVGDQLQIIGTEQLLPVVGFTYGGTYGHVPIAYTTLATWQELIYGRDARGRFSALALRVSGDVDLAELDRASGTETVAKEAAYSGSPGYSAETATMTLIRGFLLVISALVVGAFFTVWTVQRTRQIGLLKALGASNAYVARDALGQLAVLLVIAIVIGTAVGVLIGRFLGDSVPFSLTLRAVGGSSIALAIAGMLGSAAALRRLTNIDPVLTLAVES